MSTLLLAVLLLGEPPAVPPASPSPATSDTKREKAARPPSKRAPAPKKAPPSKVLTNEDLEKARQGGAAVSMLAADGVEPAPVDGGSEGAEGTSSDEAGIPEDPNKAIWRTRAEAVRTRIKDAAALVQQVELRLAQLRDNLRPGDPMNPFQQQSREAEIQAETERLEEARVLVAAGRQAQSDLEDEARSAGIPPGWLSAP